MVVRENQFYFVFLLNLYYLCTLNHLNTSIMKANVHEIFDIPRRRIKMSGEIYHAKYYFLFVAMFLSSFSCSGNKENKDRAAADIKVKTKTSIPENPSESRTPANENVETADKRGYIVKVGDMAPDFSLRLTNGETFKLSEMRGKTLMLQFTASWCSVCRKEMPFIERDIWQKHKDNPNFYLLGIDRDEPLDKVQEFIKQTGVTYPVALDPDGDVFALYAERNAGITRNVIVNAEGRIVMLTRLYNEDEFAKMCKLINEMLDK